MEDKTYKSGYLFGTLLFYGLLIWVGHKYINTEHRMFMVLMVQLALLNSNVISVYKNTKKEK